jgi:hypothetical protein
MATQETPKLVFIPPIGFRPVGTRTLRERAETIADGMHVLVLAIAAAPGHTDVVVEWKRTGDPATCPPGSSILVHSNRAPLENGLAAELRMGATKLIASTAERHAFHFSHSSIGAVDMIRFPPLPAGANEAELRLVDGGSEWRVPLSLVLGGARAMRLAAKATRAGVVIRATAVTRYEDELIVELEVEASVQVRQVGAPVPSPHALPGDSEEDRRARRAEMHRHFGERAKPITIEDDRGVRGEEVRRLFSHEPQQSAPGGPFTSRFSAMFDAPSNDAKSATLVIPFVELSDRGPSATADLRMVPLDVQMAEHRFRVVSVEPYGSEQRKLMLELAHSEATPRFVQPARLQGSDAEFGWERHAVDVASPGRDAIWMATKVGDPPIVTFTGVVLRVDGPLRLALPLT